MLRAVEALVHSARRDHPPAHAGRIDTTITRCGPVCTVVATSAPSLVGRDALLDGCALVIQFGKKDRAESTARVCGFNPERCERRIALATALDEQLEAGYAVVDVPVEVADGVARNVAEVIGEEMAALVCDTYDKRPCGFIRRAGGLMETLVALDAGIQPQVMPFDTFTLAHQ